jgi:uncharacterized RDD family membrane protein YckC/tRNA A-37 threonylcarbamoyl transferase component Bud32
MGSSTAAKEHATASDDGTSEDGSGGLSTDDTLLADSDGLADSEAIPSAEPSLSRWQGAMFDHYRVLEPIGQGGMGAVFLGHDTSLDRKVAIKVLPPELEGESQLQERFVREARAQARLQSAHVAHIHHIGHTPTETEDDPPSLYFAMEHVSGGSLDDVVDRGETLDAERARHLMIQAALGLRDAHEAGIVHRDIKPGNLLLDKNGSLKIADFGVAKPLDSDTQLSIAGAIVGSPMYMPPEQAKGLPVDHRADMYSLGCSFYHLLSGQPPFDANTPVAIVSKHLSEPTPSLIERAPDVPPKLSAVIERLMRKEPRDRYADYEELIDALEAAAPDAIRYAGFWARVAAVMIDAILAGIAIGVIGWPGMILYLAYTTYAHHRWGQTIGKYLLNLTVERVDGQPLELGRSLARTLAALWMPLAVGLVILLTEGTDQLFASIEKLNPRELDAVKSYLVASVVQYAILSLLYFGGLILAAFHPQKRAVHDLVVGTHVVYRLESKAPRRLATTPPPPPTAET